MEPYIHVCQYYKSDLDYKIIVVVNYIYNEDKAMHFVDIWIPVLESLEFRWYNYG